MFIGNVCRFTASKMYQMIRNVEVSAGVGVWYMSNKSFCGQFSFICIPIAVLTNTTHAYNLTYLLIY